MLLYLKILAYRNQPVPPAAPAGFSGAGGTIGRAPENDLVLDDASKYISRVHAKVALQAARAGCDRLGFLDTTASDWVGKFACGHAEIAKRAASRPSQIIILRASDHFTN